MFAQRAILPTRIYPSEVSRDLILVVKDISEIRRINALSLLATKWGGKKSAMAAALEVQPGYVTRILVPGSAGEREIGDEMARRIEQAAGVTENWLDQVREHLLPGVAEQVAPTTTVKPALPTRGRVPVVSWVIAGEWAEIDDPQQLLPEDYEWVDTIEPLDETNAIALLVEGTSMYDPSDPNSFEPGCYIVVKSVRVREPKSGDFVVVRLEKERRATFKQLIIDGDSKYLKPLNPSLPTIHVQSEATFVGVVAEKIVRKRY